MRHSWLALKDKGLIHSWTFQEGSVYGNSACGMWRLNVGIGKNIIGIDRNIKSTNRRCKSCERVLAQ